MNPDDFTSILESSRSTRGNRSRNIGDSHQVVVADRPSSSPVWATTNVPVHAAATKVPALAQPTTAAPARRTSRRASAAPNGSGILAPSAGTTTASGRVTWSSGSSATLRPWCVRALVETPTSRTSKGAGVLPEDRARSLAVSRVSSTAARPVSNAPSKTST